MRGHLLQGRTAWLLALLLWCAPIRLAYAQASPKAHPASPSATERQAASNSEEVPTTNRPSPTSLTLGGINGYQGLVVRNIQFRGFSEDSKVMQHLHELVAQQSGQPLDKAHIRRSIQALYATGKFATIQVEAEKTPQNEVRLVFNARENYFIGLVAVEGNPRRPTASQLVNASKLQLGELYTPEKVQRAIQNLKSVLADNGYYQAAINDDEELHSETQQVTIRFYIVPNPPARIGQVKVEGNPGLSEEQIQDIAHMHAGDVVSSDRLTKGLQRLRKKYQKQGRLEAQVSIVDRSYHPNENRLDYLFRIERGPTVDIKVEGAKIRKGLLKKYVPVFEENAVDDDLLNEGRRNLRDYLQTQGYFDAKVEFHKNYNSATNHLNVIYDIDRGPSHTLDAVLIDGNKYFDDETIRERMGVRPASGLLTHGIFSQSQLSRDLQSIENLYKANGFLSVKVKGSVADDYKGSKTDIAVAIAIEEGPQSRVNSLQIVGNKSFSTERIEALLTTIPGQPFSEFNVAQDRESVVNFYFNDGFPGIQFESSSKPAEGKPTLVDVVFTIREGEQVFVDRILLSGLNFTRPYIVRRELKVEPNTPLSQIGMLESQRRLYDLGIFNEVDVAVQNPDGAAKFKDVLFEVREAKRWTFNYGFGFEVQTGSQSLNSNQINTAPAPGVNVPPNTTPPQSVNTANPQGGTGISPRVSFDLTRLNFRGRDHTLTFKSHLSQLSRRALVSYDAPRWFDRENLRLTFSAFADNSRDVRTFASQRYEGSVQAEQIVSKVTTLLYRFQYRRVSVDANTLVISPELIPTLSKPVRVGIPSFTYIRDKRDDPIDTHKGNYTTFDTGVAASVFGSATNFGKLLVQNSTYVPIKKKFVLARSTRIGVEEPFGTGNSAIVPLPEEFFAGGSQSHRGFSLNQAGPRDLFTGFPLGGSAVFVNQVELRLPPYPLPFVDENLNFVLFHDSGNVFATGQDMVKSLFRWYQPRRGACSSEANRLNCDFNYMSHAAGLGARYRTPIGPIRVDVSYNFNPPSFPFFVQCPPVPPTGKNPGPCGSLPGSSLIFQSGTLRHFNFFFSIGQSF
jgi:outer membrane protein assembly factor BamA